MSIAEDQSKTVTGFPIMNPAGEAVISGNQASTGGGVYPYAAPPPGPFDSDPQRLRRASTLRCIIFCVIYCIVIVILILILILTTTPVIPDVQLDSASVSSFNVSTSGLTANWDLGLTIIDPNKKVHYDKFAAYMVYDGENLGGTSLLSLDQQNRKHIRMQVKFTAASAYVSDDAAKSMAEDRIQRAVNFDLKLVSWESSSSSTLMTASCNNIRVSFSSDSGVWSMAGGPIGCDVVYEN